MSFDEFWEKNYKEKFGLCEPYIGIAAYAFENGREEGMMFAQEIINKSANEMIENLTRAGI